MVNYKINILKQVVFLYTNNNLLESIMEETKILMYKFNKNVYDLYISIKLY